MVYRWCTLGVVHRVDPTLQPYAQLVGDQGLSVTHRSLVARVQAAGLVLRGDISWSLLPLLLLQSW